VGPRACIRVAEPYMRALRLLAQKDCISLSEYARLVLEEHVREMAANSIGCRFAALP